MSSTSVSVRGLEELSKRFGASKNIINEAFTKALTGAVILTQGESAKITPIDRGQLRSGHKTAVRETPDGIVGVVYNNTEYASAVHDGTSRWPLSSPPKNPNTVRQFFKVVAEREGIYDKFWSQAANDIANKLAN